MKKTFARIFLLLIMLSLSLLIAFCLMINYDLSSGKSFIVLFASIIIFMIFIGSLCLQLVNIKLFFKRRFNVNRKLRRIAYLYLKEGIDVQIKRLISPAKWFSSPPPPWFLIIDLFNSEIEALLQDKSMMPSNSITRKRTKSNKNCRWWFFPNAMYFTISCSLIYNKENIKTLWNYIVRLVCRWCRTPSGIILCLPINILIQNEEHKNNSNVRMIRHALDLLFSRLEKRLPVYIIFTNIQDIRGADRWLEGYVDATDDGLAGEFLTHNPNERVCKQVIKSIGKFYYSLSIQRLKLLNKRRGLPDDEFLLFPERIEKMKFPVAGFLSSLCEKDAYLQSGILSGIFFTGTIVNARGDQQSIFSQHLLTECIPRHKTKVFFIPKIKSIATLIALMSIAVTIFALCINSFLQINIDENNTLYQQGLQPLEKNYHNFSEMVELFEQPTYRLFFYPALKWLLKEKARQYVSSMRNENFSPNEINRNLLSRFRMAGVSEKAALIINWAMFINSEKRIADGASLQQINSMPEYSASILIDRQSKLSFSELMALRKAANVLGYEQDFKSWRQTLMTMIAYHPDLTWVLSASIPENHKDIKIINYWPGVLSSKENAVLPWIFTQQGEKYLNNILDSLQDAVGNSPLFLKSREEFWKNYLLKRQSSWLSFADHMMLTDLSTLDKQAWRDVALSIYHIDSPYNRLISDLDSDLSTISDRNAAPWLLFFRRLKSQSSLLIQSKLILNLTRDTMLMRDKLKQYQTQKQELVNPYHTIYSDGSLASYKIYKDELQFLAQEVVYEKHNAKKFLVVDDGKSEINKLFIEFKSWKMASSGDKDIDAQTQLIWSLLQGNARLLRDYVFLKAADEMQNEWKNQVIWPLNVSMQENPIDSIRLEKDLYQHIVIFIKKNAAGFLDLKDDEILSHPWQGKDFPFTPGFLNYINFYIKKTSITEQDSDIRKTLLDEKLQLNDSSLNINALSNNSSLQNGIDNSSAVLTIEGQPSTANHDARLLPIGTSLRLVCTDGDQQLTNMNFNIQTKLNWNPNNCTDVNLIIFFPYFSLEKTYSGTQGLLNFIKDFSSGEHRYHVHDFNFGHQFLNEYEIKSVLVRFTVHGQDNIISSYNQWQLKNDKRMELEKKRQSIDGQLNNLGLSDKKSGILISLPERIVNVWD
jgi:type VI secretion system protein ImpL